MATWGPLAALGVCYWLLLASRNPFRPKWMDKELTASLLVMTVLSVLIVAIGFFMKGLLGLGLDPLVGLGVTTVVLGVLSWALWKALHMKERLEAAEAGHSPFALGRDRIGRA